jgi:hypothetical protein
MRARRVVLLAVALWAIATPAADAHTVTGVAPTNYASEVLEVRPSLRGVTARTLDLGRRMELRNHGRDDLVILGYSGEPYLRVGPHGVFENRRSPTTYLNRPATVTGAPEPVPKSASATARPEWRRVSTGTRARWRDRRTRVEGTTSTAAVRHPRGKAIVSNWAIDARLGDHPIAVVGRITYVPPPNPWPWVALMVLLVAATVVAAWSRAWGRWLSVALGVLLASDAIQSFGTAAATHDSLGAQLARVLLAGLVTTIAWIAGVVALPALQRNHEGGLVAAGAVGLVIAGFSGVTDVGALTHSQVAIVFPAVTARVAVVLAVGIGVGLVAAAAAVIARDPSLRPTVAPHSGRTGL